MPPDPTEPGGDSKRSHVNLSCSFCGKGQREVLKLIAGPTVHICDECVRLCNNILLEVLLDDAKQPDAQRKGLSAIGSQVELLEKLLRLLPNFPAAALEKTAEVSSAVRAYVKDTGLPLPVPPPAPKPPAGVMDVRNGVTLLSRMLSENLRKLREVPAGTIAQATHLAESLDALSATLAALPPVPDPDPNGEPPR